MSVRSLRFAAPSVAALAAVGLALTMLTAAPPAYAKKKKEAAAAGGEEG